MSQARKPRKIDSLMAESRTFPPPAGLAAAANAQPSIYEQDPDGFWDGEGRNRLSWFTPYTTLKEWKLPYAKWFLGGKLNACYNCVDRHVENGLGERVAYYWEGEPVGDRQTITFADLQHRVVQAANGFRSVGIAKGSHVGVYLGMVPEAVVTMLALARIGAAFTLVFGRWGRHGMGDRHRGGNSVSYVRRERGPPHGAPAHP